MEPIVSSPLLALLFRRKISHLAASGASGLSTQVPAGEGPHLSCMADLLAPASVLSILAQDASDIRDMQQAMGVGESCPPLGTHC